MSKMNGLSETVSHYPKIPGISTVSVCNLIIPCSSLCKIPEVFFSDLFLFVFFFSLRLSMSLLFPRINFCFKASLTTLKVHDFQAKSTLQQAPRLVNGTRQISNGISVLEFLRSICQTINQAISFVNGKQR